jgi:hypothetical protein
VVGPEPGAGVGTSGETSGQGRWVAAGAGAGGTAGAESGDGKGDSSWSRNGGCPNSDGQGRRSGKPHSHSGKGPRRPSKAGSDALHSRHLSWTHLIHSSCRRRSLRAKIIGDVHHRIVAHRQHVLTYHKVTCMYAL